MAGDQNGESDLSNVLVVDDHEHGYLMITRALRGIDPQTTKVQAHSTTYYAKPETQVQWATSAAEAMVILEQHRIDAAFIDINLGSESGLDLLRDLRAQHIRCPLIVLTAMDDRESEQACLDAGADDVLIKSEVRPATIRRALRVALHHRELMDRLSDQNRRYVDLAQNFPKGSVLVFRDQTCVLAAGSGCATLLRVSPERAQGRHPQQLLPEAIAEFVRDSMAQPELLEHHDDLLQITIKDRHYLVRVTQDTADCDEFLVTVQDVSDFKINEEAMLRSMRLASIGTLASGLAHELNNLHSVIMGNAERALRDVDPSHNAHRRLDNIHDCCRRAGEVTTNLMTFARGFRSGFSLCDINEIINDTAQLIYQELVGCQTDFQLDLKPCPRLWVQESGLGQVIINLLLNAHQSLYDSSDRRVVVTTKASADMVHIAVSDNGCGMEPSVLSRLFEPFFTTKDGSQHDRHTHKTILGTGIGMSVSHTIIENHGGAIRVDSIPGQGTTVTIDLPLRTLHHRNVGSSGIHLNPSTESRGTLLVIDDDSTQLERISSALREDGWQVLTACNGEEGWQLLANETIEMALIDLMMPVLSGWQVLDRLATLPDPPAIITMSGIGSSPDLGDRHIGLVDEHLAKPIALDKLRTTVSILHSRIRGVGLSDHPK